MKLAIRFLVVIGLAFSVMAMSGCSASVTSAVTGTLNKIDSVATGTVIPATCDLATWYQTYLGGAIKSSNSGAVKNLTTAVNDLNSYCESGALTSTVNAAVATADIAVTAINAACAPAVTPLPTGAIPPAAQ